MATTPAPQVQGWHPGSTRIVAALMGVVIVAIAAAGLMLILTDGDESVAASTGASNPTFFRAGAQLDGGGEALAITELPTTAVAPSPTFFRAGAQLDGGGLSLAEQNAIAGHTSGVEATLFALGESGTGVDRYVAEHDSGIDAVLGYEMSEFVGPAAQ
jgi:hypothetical protein